MIIKFKGVFTLDEHLDVLRGILKDKLALASGCVVIDKRNNNIKVGENHV